MIIPSHRLGTLATCFLLTGIPLPATAQPALERPGFDSATGRDMLNYPPHRSADIRHIRLDLVVRDMNTPAMSGVATIRFAAFAGDVSVLTLNAAELNIRSVSSATFMTRLTANPGDDNIEIAIDPPLPQGHEGEVRIEYEVADAAEGLVWTPESPLWPSRPAAFHSQGEPESNRYWFPCFDFPNERLTSEVSVTVPAGFVAVSNGRQIARTRTELPDGKGAAETFHFLQDKEHAAYLISLAVGKFDIVNLGSTASGAPLQLYVKPGEGRQSKVVFARTPKMIGLFERLFGQPYPWDKYAQVAATNFGWGGMENTSATTLYDTVVLDPTALLDGDNDGLIAHELAHQWFGNLLTCKSWEHIWLNEGWATYAEALWAEYRESPGLERARGKSPLAGLRADSAAYLAAIWAQYEDVIDRDSGEAPFAPGMVSKQYWHPDETFERDANPYPKGAAVLHMLRQKLGDEVFFAAITEYTSRYQNQPVETHQFRTILEQISGVSLQRFFEQWCSRPGIPRLAVTPEWSDSEQALFVTVEQLQKIDGYNPAFFFDLPLWIDHGDGSAPLLVTIPVDSGLTRWSIPVPMSGMPKLLVANPELELLAEIDLRVPVEMLSRQARSGPTIASRLQAIVGLAGRGGSVAIATLADEARNFASHQSVRIAAVEALGELIGPDIGDRLESEREGRPRRDERVAETDPAAFASLLQLAKTSFKEPPLRAAVLEQLGRLPHTRPAEERKAASAILIAAWKEDASYAVRSAAIESLGKIRSVDAMGIFQSGLGVLSQHDQIREAAVRAIGYAEFPDAVEKLLPMTAPSRSAGVRREAIFALGRLSPRDPERIMNLLSALVQDSDQRVRRAALSELARSRDPRARLLVEQFISATRSRSDRIWAQGELVKAERR